MLFSSSVVGRRKSEDERIVWSAKEGLMAKKTIFEACLAVIAFVTAVDIFWSIYLSESLLLHEQNPAARWVIYWGNKLEINGIALLCVESCRYFYCTVCLPHDL